MVRYVTGDIFTSHVQTLVNTVNCRGVMGKGLALQFKNRFPNMYNDYVKRCRSGQVRIGRPYLFQTESVWILNFPTKDDWRRPSRLDFIEQGLEYFAASYADLGIRSVAFPQLGCQNGGLSWDEVGPLMVRHLEPLTLDVEIFVRDLSQAIAVRQPMVGLLDIVNRATNADELREVLGGIQLKLAEGILAYRTAHGPFKQIDDLMHVKGVGPKTLRKIEAQVFDAARPVTKFADRPADDVVLQPLLL